MGHATQDWLLLRYAGVFNCLSSKTDRMTEQDNMLTVQTWQVRATQERAKGCLAGAVAMTSGLRTCSLGL